MPKARSVQKVWKILVAFVAIATILGMVLPFVNL